MNRAFSEAGWPDARDPERLWIEHTRGVHLVMDRLRAAEPDLRIESCSGGGGRLDLAILARTDQVWASDNTDAADRLRIQHGYTQLYPPGTLEAWVTDSPNTVTGRRTPLAFRFHVAMTGVLGSAATWPPGPRPTGRRPPGWSRSTSGSARSCSTAGSTGWARNPAAGCPRCSTCWVTTWPCSSTTRTARCGPP